jgi:hypothetical protein
MLETWSSMPISMRSSQCPVATRYYRFKYHESSTTISANLLVPKFPFGLTQTNLVDVRKEEMLPYLADLGGYAHQDRCSVKGHAKEMDGCGACLVTPSAVMHWIKTPKPMQISILARTSTEITPLIVIPRQQPLSQLPTATNWGLVRPQSR